EPALTGAPVEDVLRVERDDGADGPAREAHCGPRGSQGDERKERGGERLRRRHEDGTCSERCDKDEQSTELYETLRRFGVEHRPLLSVDAAHAGRWKPGQIECAQRPSRRREAW